MTILMAEVMTVTWKPPCLVFEPNPLQGASENRGLRQTPPEHGEAGEGPVVGCPQAADPGQSPPVLVSRGMTKMKPMPLTEHAGLCPAWPSRISPLPHQTPAGSQICHDLKFGGSEYVVLLIWNILLSFKDSSCSCMSLVKLPQTDSWTPFLVPLVLIMLCAPPHDNSSLTASAVL